jgi:hypothetical protein
MTKWKEFINYVNTHEIIKRTEMNTLGSTVDSYRNFLQKIGLIERISYGVFKRLYKVPLYISSSEMFIIAYDKEKSENLIHEIIINERKEKLLKIKNRICLK